jgi:hypothetical protein
MYLIHLQLVLQSATLVVEQTTQVVVVMVTVPHLEDGALLVVDMVETVDNSMQVVSVVMVQVVT